MKFRLLSISNIIQNRSQLAKQAISSTKEIIAEIWLPITLFFAYVIIATTNVAKKLAFIPDGLNLQDINPQDYFGLIIGAIASIFGIVMAVILLTVEVFKERLNRNTHTNPLENQLIRNSIYSSISLIGLSFIAYLQIDSFNNSKYVTLGYFIGIIFIAYIYSIYPVLKTIIGKSSKIKQNIDITNLLSLNSFKNVSRQRFTGELQEDDKLKVLKNEIDSYILSHNFSAYEKINNDVLKKALNFIAEGQDRNQSDLVITGLVWLWRENCKTAIRSNDTQYFEMIWGYIRDIYVFFSIKKAPLLHLQNLHLFIIFDFLNLHIKLENSTPFSTAIRCIEESFKTNLVSNCPRQEDLKGLVSRYEGGGYVSTPFKFKAQWDAINDILGIINSIQETAIKLSDKDTFEESSRKIQSICTDLYYENYPIGNYLKSYITSNELTSSFYSSSNALNSGLYDTTLDCFEIPKDLIVHLIENDIGVSKDIRRIMTSLGDYLILAFKGNKLAMDKHFGTLLNFCNIGIHCIKFYKERKIAKKTVDYIIRVLKHLKKLSEKNKNSMNANDYLAIKSRLNHFIDVAVRMDNLKVDEKPVKDWKKIYESFQDVSEIKDFGIVKWKVKNE